MKSFFSRLIRLIFGLFLYALGIMLTIYANIGYAPWDVFHVGVSNTFGVSLGKVSILTGLAIVLLTILMGEKFGLGTILNMILIGVFIDWIIVLGFIPQSTHLLSGILMLVGGLAIIAFATYFYISSGFGTGPRDGLMVALSRKLNLSVGACRSIIELTVMILGYFLGGMVGVGTVLCVFLIGFIIQITFRLVRFDPKEIHHENVKESWQNLKAIYQRMK